MKLNLDKTIEYLFYLFVFLLPWQTRWIWRYGELNGGRWEYGMMALFGTEILLWGILFLVKSQKSKVKSPNNNLKLENLKLNQNSKFKIQNFILVFFIYLLISISWSLNKTLAAYNIVHLIEAFILIYLILKINFNYKKIFYAILASAFVQAILGIWQFVNQYVVANKWLGMAEQDPSVLGVSVVGTVLRRWLRAYGGFSHPNVLAGFLGIGFLVGMYLIVNHVVENKKQLYGKIGLIFVNLIILIGILFTFSRGGWVSLIIVILLYCYIVFRKGIKGAKPPIGGLAPASQRLKLFIVYCLLLTSVIIFVFKEPFLTRIKSETRLEQKSTSERLGYYKESWQLIKKSPWLGVGVGNYTLAVYDLIDSERDVWEYQPAHNVFVLILVELGVVGVGLLIGLLVYLFISLKKGSKGVGHPIGCPTPASLLLLLALIGLFDHYLWTSYFGVMLVGLVVGLNIRNDEAAASLKHT